MTWVLIVIAALVLLYLSVGLVLDLLIGAFTIIAGTFTVLFLKIFGRRSADDKDRCNG